MLLQDRACSLFSWLYHWGSFTDAVWFVLQFKVYIYWLVLKLLLIYQACFKSFPKILEIVLWMFCHDQGRGSLSPTPLI
jgi:hypothetical protein